MGLLSIFQRKKQTAAKPAKSRAKAPARQAPAANPADTAEAVRDARARARRRLMGATVLLLAGVIGFPLLFETQPRPIPVDLPIEIPARNGVAVVDAPVAAATHARGPSSAALALAAANQAAASSASASAESVSYGVHPVPASAAALPPSAGQVGSRPSGFSSLAAALTPAALHGSEAAAASAAAASGVQDSAYVKPKPAKPASQAASRLVAQASHPVAPAASRPTAQAASAPAARPPVVAHVGPVLPPPATTNAGSTDTAAGLLASKPAGKASDAATEGGRFVVQIGAFADDAKMHEARGKVEKLGLKTYTQSVDTPSGKRVRVRVGPYATKAEADKAAAKIKSDGLPAAVLAL